MGIEAADLLRDALSLPPEARAALVDSLLESLDADGEDTTFDVDAREAWQSEIDRRIRLIDSRSVRMIPWEEAKTALRSSLRP
jgi:putative addiction module component (TIGR02574 family)